MTPRELDAKESALEREATLDGKLGTTANTKSVYQLGKEHGAILERLRIQMQKENEEQ